MAVLFTIRSNRRVLYVRIMFTLQIAHAIVAHWHVRLSNPMQSRKQQLLMPRLRCVCVCNDVGYVRFELEIPKVVFRLPYLRSLSALLKLLRDATEVHAPI